MKALASLIGMALGIMMFAGCEGSTSDAPDLAAERAKAMKMSDPVARSRKLVVVADRQRKVGDVLGAKSTLLSAADAAEKVEDPASKTSSLTQVAASLLRGGDLTDGRDTLRKAEQAAEQITDSAAKAGVLAEMAVIYQEESPDKADYLLSTAKEEAEKVTDADQKGMALVRVGAALVQADKAEEARATLEQAAELARGQEEARKKADGLTDAAIAAMKLDAEFGAKLLAEADAAADAGDSALTKAHAQLSIAKKLTLAGKKTEARVHAAKASDIADKVKDASLRSELVDQVNKLKLSL